MKRFPLVLVSILLALIAIAKPEKIQDSTLKQSEYVTESSTHSDDELQNTNFFKSLIKSTFVVALSDFGDNTFFIAAVMAMKYSRVMVFSGAVFALSLMTLLSVLLGGIVTSVIPKVFIQYISSFLFAVFGLKMFYEAWKMRSDKEKAEFEEAVESLRESEDDIKLNKNGVKRFLRKYMPSVFLQSFLLNFFAEWGDRSQISTFMLGASENMLGTIIGGSLGQAFCTALAVIGGRIAAKKIGIRNVTFCGALLFICFAISAILSEPLDD